MKKKSTSQSAFFTLRILIAAVCCLAGVAVALFSMGAFSNVFAQAKEAKTNQDAPGTQTPDVVRMLGPVSLDQDLRSLPYVAPKQEFEERGPRTRYPHLDTDQTSAATGSGTPGLPNVQNLLKNVLRPTPTMPSRPWWMFWRQ